MLTRTDRRRFPILLAAIAVLALAGTALGLLFSTAEAQEAETLVSNIDQGSTLTDTSSLPHGQTFRTGPYAYGYTLSTVDVVSADAEGTSFEVKVCTADVDDHPTSTCMDLAAPGSFAAGTITFYAPANYVLESRTYYTVVLTPPSQGDRQVTFGLTTADGEDAGLADGWSISNTHVFWNQNLSPDDWGTSGSGRSFRIAINGSEAPEPETTENQPGEIRAYWTGHDPDNDKNNGNSRTECAGTEPFRAYWERLSGADDWEAEVTPQNGASNVVVSTINADEEFAELTGSATVPADKFSSLSIRVRGRFGDDGWGAWSRPTGLYCNIGGG